MLKHLLIKNYALLEHLEMTPSPHFNIITGETGAGKSIMLGAVGLLLGNRADIKALYHDEEKCVVEAAFHINAYSLQAVFEAQGLDYEETTIVRREISPTGKSRAFVNDTPVTLDVLRELGERLVDVHSQHDTLLLASNKFQMGVIDAFAATNNLLQQWEAGYKAYRNKKQAYEALLSESEALKQEADYNQFLYDELLQAGLVAGELEELEQELKVLEHAEEIKLKLGESLLALSDSEFSVSMQLAQVKQAIGSISKFAPGLEELRGRIESTAIELQDVEHEMRKEEEKAEYDPEKIQLTKDRLDLIHRLLQKHRTDTIAGLLTIQQTLEVKVMQVKNMDDTLASAQNALKDAEEKMNAHGEVLSKRRMASFDSFCSSVVSVVKELGMPLATLGIDHRRASPSETGLDEINILFSANKGIAPREIKDVASGGEFSRAHVCHQIHFS